MELHEPKNLYELLTLNMEQRFANRVAFRWYDADQDVVVEKHFEEYAQDIRRAVNYYLSTIPDIQGKRVCVWSNNSYHYAVNCYGVMMAGGVIVPMNQRKSWDELHRELELVEPSAILTDGDDYGKFRFEQGKREKEARKNQHVVEIKEVRMSPGIDVGDFNTKLKNAQKFIADGNRVKVSVRFRGREMAHTDIGRDLLVRFAESVAEVANLDKEPKMEGRSMSIFLSPKAGK